VTGLEKAGDAVEILAEVYGERASRAVQAFKAEKSLRVPERAQPHRRFNYR
jgi:hypothetical protein